MSNTDNHPWDLKHSGEGSLPESNEAFDKKLESGLQTAANC